MSMSKGGVSVCSFTPPPSPPGYPSASTITECNELLAFLKIASLNVRLWCNLTVTSVNQTALYSAFLWLRPIYSVMFKLRKCYFG